MGMPVVTVASGGLPVVEAANGYGTPVIEATNGFGQRVTKVAKYGVPVVYATAGGNPGILPPTYVNVSTQATATATAVALTLPTARVNGNLLVAFLFVNTPSSPTVTWPGGWTPIDHSGGSGAPAASWAYRYVDGAETNPTVTWTTSSTARGGIMQLSGVKATSPIGSISKNYQASGTVVTCPQIVPVGFNSMALLVVHLGFSIAPAGWTGCFDMGASKQQGHRKALAAIGGGSGAISVTTAAFTTVTSMMAEIKSQ